jgi:hypothetical protein
MWSCSRYHRFSSLMPGHFLIWLNQQVSLSYWDLQEVSWKAFGIMAQTHPCPQSLQIQKFKWSHYSTFFENWRNWNDRSSIVWNNCSEPVIRTNTRCTGSITIVVLHRRSSLVKRRKNRRRTQATHHFSFLDYLSIVSATKIWWLLMHALYKYILDIVRVSSCLVK